MNALWRTAHDLEAAALSLEAGEAISLTALASRLRRAYIAVGETAAQLTNEGPEPSRPGPRDKKGENTNTMLPLDPTNNSPMPDPLRTHHISAQQQEAN